MSSPDIALLLSTYQRPGHLRRSLASIALQQDVKGGMELVVTDDGSTDETPGIVAEFANSVNFPVHFTTHEHTTFQLARCRNEGVRASTAPYLLFLDGDCLLPPDHVRIHLERQHGGLVLAGDCCRLEQGPSEQIDEAAILGGNLARYAPEAEIQRLKKLHRSSQFYRFIRHPTKPKLFGNNVGIWRADYERVNGYDENFQGWGCEDDDLRQRLRRAGIAIESIIGETYCYHLWHPTDVTAPSSWKQGANVRYLLQRGRLTRCRNGLVRRPLEDLAICIVGNPSQPQAVERLIGGHLRIAPETRASRSTPEVEILFLPGSGKFTGRAECNVLVALDENAVTPQVEKQAHFTVTPKHGWDELEQALRQVA